MIVKIFLISVMKTNKEVKTKKRNICIKHEPTNKELFHVLAYFWSSFWTLSNAIRSSRRPSNLYCDSRFSTELLFNLQQPVQEDSSRRKPDFRACIPYSNSHFLCHQYILIFTPKSYTLNIKEAHLLFHLQ